MRVGRRFAANAMQVRYEFGPAIMGFKGVATKAMLRDAP